MILFVSNVQNGGLNAAEANYLKRLSQTMGGLEQLKAQTLFLLSNMHQMDESGVKKVITEHSNNIKSALGFSPDKIHVYDAITYQEGVKENSSELKKLSGIESVKKAIESSVSNVENNRSELWAQRIIAI